ncbi:hypothetical protein GCM10015536_44780 [Streptomyces griseomycini]|nr:hypothetical protein GCM10015536_44780 [Streptomyces griseomycini]
MARDAPCAPSVEPSHARPAPSPPLPRPGTASAPARGPGRGRPAAAAIWSFSQAARGWRVRGGMSLTGRVGHRARRIHHRAPPRVLAGCVPLCEKAYSLSEGKA